jgi:hypothetical protein
MQIWMLVGLSFLFGFTAGFLLASFLVSVHENNKALDTDELLQELENLRSYAITQLAPADTRHVDVQDIIKEKNG